MDTKFFKKDLVLIPQTMEKYVGWFVGDFAFLDSFAYLAASLDTLSKGLSQQEKEHMLRQQWETEDLTDLCGKAALPYEYLDSLDRYGESELPPIEKFYTSLTDSNITLEMYERLTRIWNQFSCQSLGQLIDIYLRLDVLMLAAVFENFRETSIRDFGIDPPHYMSVPGLSFSAAIKMLKVSLEIFSDLDMYIMIENGIRGGFTTVARRYAKANNPQIDGYDGGDQTWLLYLDVNNLYGYAMVDTLPYGDYKWTFESLNTITSTPDDSDVGYILEVDLVYPDDLHDEHNDFPLAPHKMTIQPDMLSGTAKEILERTQHKLIPTSKLVSTFLPRNRYVIHYRTLKYYLSKGLHVTRVHRIISFKQSKWMKPYIEFCISKRKEATSPFESALYKLFVNSNYGKLMEDKRKRVKVDLVLNNSMAERRVRNHLCKSMKIIDDDKILFQMLPDRVVLDKPIIVGFTVLELAKLHVYKLYYDRLKAFYKSRMSLIYSDTDSLLVEVKSNSLNDEMKSFSDIMDYSDLPKENPLSSDHNKKRIGCLKDEMAGEVIEEVVALRPKLYAVKTKQNVHKKAKGIQKCVLEKKLTFEDYKDSLFNTSIKKTITQRIGSEGHELFQFVQEKVSISPFEDKRYLTDSVNSLAYGHYKIK